MSDSIAKKTYNVKIWGTGGSAYVATGKSDRPYAYRNNDKLRLKRDSLQNMLENLLGHKNFRFDKANYQFIVELTEEEAAKVRSWEVVKRVVAKE